MAYLSQVRNMENFMESLLRDHRRYLPVVEFLDGVIANADELTWHECEEIGLALGQQNGSEFCAGIRGGMLGALENKAGASANDRRLQPVLDFAAKLNADSSAITEGDIEKVRSAGWSDQTIEDVVGLVAALKVYSTLAHGFGFKALPNEAFAEMGNATVAMGGYTPLFKSFLAQAGGAANA